MPLPPGTSLGAYQILSSLGEGGMGEVYLAQDTRLGRKVALKVIGSRVRADESAKRRFWQEAQTASALNHPNIVSIFDVGQSDGHDFLAMEYVEGDTLRAMLSQGKTDIRRAFELIAQAAAGLAAAHDASIIHRDIKPENLIVSRAGHLKILDFGLAKLNETQQVLLTNETATATRAPDLTTAGAIIGTTAYMSPEQAQGSPLDGRTDVFSLGVVLYELLTGEKAFSGPSTIDVLHAIVHTTPRPAIDVNPRLPPEVMDLLDKALAKDPAERYRHAGDFALDLRRFKRAYVSGSLPSMTAGRSVVAPRSRLASWTLGAAAIGVLAGVGAVLLVRGPAPSATPASASARATMTPLTTDPGYEGEPTFAPDGETLAYVADRTGNFEIFLKQVSGGADVNITNHPGADVQPAYSPDGRQIAFVSTREGASDLLYTSPDVPPRGGDVWVMPALGGNEKRIARNGNFPSWSPDGTDVIFAAGPWFGPKLFRVSASGGEPREIPLQFSPGANPSHLIYPRFSSDGKWIAFSSQAQVFVVSATGGPATAIARGRGAAWGAGSRSIIYSNIEVGINQSLWEIPFNPATGTASGVAHAVTVGRGADLQVASSRDGARIAFAATDVSTHVEMQPFDAETGRLHGSPAALTDSRDQIYFFDVSSEGALFDLRRGPASTVWRSDANRRLIQLASDAAYDHAYPRWSPDGKTIAFSRQPVATPQAAFSLWTMSSDGGNPQRVVEQMGLNGLFTWMPDGRGIVHVGADRQLYVLDLASGSERKLTNEPGVMPVVVISSDGKWVIYQCVVGATVDLHAVPVEGGDARVVAATPGEDYHPSVSPSGRWVYFLLDHKDLYRVPGPAQAWRSATPERVTDFQLTPISFVENPQLSRDGQLAYSRGRVTSDIWLITRSK